MATKSYKPEWIPEDADEQFATQVMPGIEDPTIRKARPAERAAVPSAKLTLDDYIQGVLAGDRMILAKAITLIESNAPRHFEMAQKITQAILPYTGHSVRVGITGVPGAGKSTLIEALGSILCRQDHKVAVLAVDPSSSISRGSILGDKTRMENLSREPNAFIRPSPSGGTLGGVTRKSRETMMLCEAAGYDVLLVETVGVGQGETTVRSMVDFFLVAVITGAGDELQGIKKGIIELADAIVVNKADGDNVQRAKNTRAEYNQILHYLRPATEGWKTQAYTCSALEGTGLQEIWNMITEFVSTMNASGLLQNRRRQQAWQWAQDMAWQHVQNRIYGSENVASGMRQISEKLLHEEITATMAAQSLIEVIEKELMGK